jgi:hypothetical protein
MGCAQSNEDGEGPVARCRERKHLLRDAVAARHALAGAHAGHAAALKNVGAALSDYASGEGEAHAGGALRSGSADSSAAAAALVTASSDGKPVLAILPPPPPELPPPPPPPPLPPHGDVEAAPLARSMSAPDLHLQQPIKKKPSGEAPIMEEEDDEGGDGGDAGGRRGDDDAELKPPPPLPSQRPPPSRSPPPLPPENDHKVDTPGGFISSLFDSMPPPTLDTAAAEPSSSASAERREPPPPAPDEHQPSAAAREVAEGKRPAAAEAATTRRAMTQKAARKGKAKAVMLVAPPQPQPAKLGVGDILRALDEHFLKASQSAHEVSKLLEAARMHYHSNFAETRGNFNFQTNTMNSLHDSDYFQTNSKIKISSLQSFSIFHCDTR